PTTRFRLAYDRFCDGREERLGAKDYLKILHHAAHTCESAIDDALRVLLARDTPLSAATVIALATTSAEIPAPTAVVVEPPDLKEFDVLLTLMEETHGQDTIQPSVQSDADLNIPSAADLGVPSADHGTIDRAIAGTAP